MDGGTPVCLGDEVALPSEVCGAVPERAPETVKDEG